MWDRMISLCWFFGLGFRRSHYRTLCVHLVLLLVVWCAGATKTCYAISQFWYADSFALSASPGMMSDINTVSVPLSINIPSGVRVNLIGCYPYEVSPTMDGRAAGAVLNRKIKLTRQQNGVVYFGTLVSATNGVGWVGDKYVIYGNHISSPPWGDYCDTGRTSLTRGIYSVSSSVRISLPADLPSGRYTLETGAGSTGFISNVGGGWTPTEGGAIVAMLGGKGGGATTTIDVPQRTVCSVNNSSAIQISHGSVKQMTGFADTQTVTILVSCTSSATVRISVSDTTKTSNRVLLKPGNAYTDLTLHEGRASHLLTFGSAGGSQTLQLRSELTLAADTMPGALSGTGVIELRME